VQDNPFDMPKPLFDFFGLGQQAHHVPMHEEFNHNVEPQQQAGNDWASGFKEGEMLLQLRMKMQTIKKVS
jgi:hypothetical protein